MATKKSTSGSSTNSYGGSDSYSYGGSSSESYGSSNTSSDTYSHTVSGSETDSYGGSSSHSTSSSQGGAQSQTANQSVGGSNSLSQGVSQTASSSLGGSSSVGTGKSWASGQVSDQTQAAYNKYSQEYQQSQAVTNAYQNLQAQMNNKPTFQSSYEDKLASMYDQIMNREKFNYDFNKDAMYQQYKDQYTTAGKQAMEDTMGRASAMTGGYGSSYTQTAGQQQYQNYLQQLNDRIPELRNQAYNEYQQEGQNLLNKYNVTQNAYNNEYQQYRDAMSDYQTDRSFDYGMYSDERNFDYNDYSSNRNYWQNQYWNEKNAEQSNVNASDSTNYSNSLSNTNSLQQSQAANWSNSLSNTDSRNWSDSVSDTNTSNWSHSSTNGWSDTSSHTDSSTNSYNYSNSSNWNNSHSSDWNKSNTSGWSNSDGATGVSGIRRGESTQYGTSASLQDMNSNERNSLISQISNNLGDSKEIKSTLKDLYNNGLTMSNGATVTFSEQDLANIYNRAMQQNYGTNSYISDAKASDIMNIIRGK